MRHKSVRAFVKCVLFIKTYSEEFPIALAKTWTEFNTFYLNNISHINVRCRDSKYLLFGTYILKQMLTNLQIV